MNPWEWVIAIFGWGLLVLMAVGAIIILFAVGVGIVRGVKKWFPKRRVTGKRSAPKLETYTAEAKVVGQEMYKDDFLFASDKVEAFRAGARWGWGFFHRK